MTDRGVSVALDYILLLMIATVMLAGVVAVSGSLINDQVELGIENELTVTGESLAGEIQEVERLANASNQDETTIELTVDLPPLVGGSAYQVDIINDGEAIQLSTRGGDHSVTIPVATDRLTSTDSSLSGGPVVIVLEIDGTIEVNEA